MAMRWTRSHPVRAPLSPVPAMKDLLLAVLEFGLVFDVLVMIADSPFGVFGALAVATLTAIGVGVAADRAGRPVAGPATRVRRWRVTRWLR